MDADALLGIENSIKDHKELVDFAVAVERLRANKDFTTGEDEPTRRKRPSHQPNRLRASKRLPVVKVKGDEQQKEPGQQEARHGEPAPEGNERLLKLPSIIEAEYKKLLAPFKANGRTVEVASIDDAMTLNEDGGQLQQEWPALKPNMRVHEDVHKTTILERAEAWLFD
ncbi:hypothetical protein FQA39_LY18824 [Lamprigera yunnana]|nr:hypothetical protein FQA39_LY18824 [Lamprigera yunnana]